MNFKMLIHTGFQSSVHNTAIGEVFEKSRSSTCIQSYRLATPALNSKAKLYESGTRSGLRL